LNSWRSDRRPVGQPGNTVRGVLTR
jgi:hypothetical protein